MAKWGEDVDFKDVKKQKCEAKKHLDKHREEIERVTPEHMLAHKLAMWAVAAIREDDIGGREFSIEDGVYLPTAWNWAQKLIKEDFPEFTIVITEREHVIGQRRKYYFQTWKVDKLRENYCKKW